MGRIAETFKRIVDILKALEEPKPISRVSRDLGLRWNTVQLYISELAELGLVEVVKQKAAPPVTLARLTPKGEQLLKCLQDIT